MPETSTDHADRAFLGKLARLAEAREQYLLEKIQGEKLDKTEYKELCRLRACYMSEFNFHCSVSETVVVLSEEEAFVFIYSDIDFTWECDENRMILYSKSSNDTFVQDIRYSILHRDADAA